MNLSFLLKILLAFFLVLGLSAACWMMLSDKQELPEEVAGQSSVSLELDEETKVEAARLPELPLLTEYPVDREKEEPMGPMADENSPPAVVDDEGWGNHPNDYAAANTQQPSNFVGEPIARPVPSNRPIDAEPETVAYITPEEVVVLGDDPASSNNVVLPTILSAPIVNNPGGAPSVYDDLHDEFIKDLEGSKAAEDEDTNEVNPEEENAEVADGNAINEDEWTAAQQESDRLYKFYFGHHAFVRNQMDLHREASSSE